MTDERLEWLANYFRHKQLHHKMTFYQFIQLYESGLMCK